MLAFAAHLPCFFNSNFIIIFFFTCRVSSHEEIEIGGFFKKQFCLYFWQLQNCWLNSCIGSLVGRTFCKKFLGFRSQIGNSTRKIPSTLFYSDSSFSVSISLILPPFGSYPFDVIFDVTDHNRIKSNTHYSDFLFFFPPFFLRFLMVLGFNSHLGSPNLGF